ncbi:hypothetical protein HMSSN036_43600 [Paenibacillus macerans]|nr:hypothetical protein HMSSN036_43600 [Paenibacillus macerans]
MMKMLTEERYDLIMKRLQEQGVVKLQELVELLDASESTVRRDLVDLENRNLLKRIHGGATLANQKSWEPGIEEKTFKNIQEKERYCPFGRRTACGRGMHLSGRRNDNAGDDSFY